MNDLHPYYERKSRSTSMQCIVMAVKLVIICLILYVAKLCFDSRTLFGILILMVYFMLFMVYALCAIGSRCSRNEEKGGLHSSHSENLETNNDKVC